MRFPGQYYDSETGLHYNYHRYYDPKAGRYLRADPVGIRGGIGLYSYCRNNPINITDFKGLDPDDYVYRVDYEYPATGRYRLRFHQESIPRGIAKWLKETFEIYIGIEKKKPVISFAISETSIYVDTRVRKEQVYWQIHKESFLHKEIARIPIPGSEIWLCESEPLRKITTAEYFPLLPDKIIVDEKELEALLNAIDEDPSWLTLFVLLHKEK